MKYAIALTMLILPAMLAAKDSCPMFKAPRAEDQIMYGLTVGWRASPLIAEQIL